MKRGRKRKLTDGQVREILAWHQASSKLPTAKAMQFTYGISSSKLYMICRRQAYRYIGELAYD